MTTWTQQRGVYLYRPRLGPGNRPLPAQEPEFPWLALPLAGLGFVLFFGGLALLGAEAHLWEGLLAVLGLALCMWGFAVVARRFL
jgi:hypothetical protein